MTEPIFNFKSLTTSDKWSVGLYTLITVALFFILEPNKNYILVYCIGTNIAIYVFYYKALRNMTFYCICLAFGLFHWLLFWFILENETSSPELIQYAANLRNTIPLLIIFQLFRLLNLLIQKEELVSPQRSSFKDMHDGRYVMPGDYLFFIVYIFFLVALTVGWKYPLQPL